MSFGQALFFGVPAYVPSRWSAATSEFSPRSGARCRIAMARRPGAVLRVRDAFLLLGQAYADADLHRAGHADRRPTRPSGSYRAGSTSAPATACRRSSCCSAGSFEFIEGIEPSTSSRSGHACSLSYLAIRALHRALADGPRARRHAAERGAPRFLRLSRAALQGGRCSRSPACSPASPARSIQLSPGLHRAGQHGAGPVDDGRASTALFGGSGHAGRARSSAPRPDRDPSATCWPTSRMRSSSFWPVILGLVLLLGRRCSSRAGMLGLVDARPAPGCIGSYGWRGRRAAPKD